ncbi:diglucosylglycerate octanoyltransferase [Nocardia sp. NPDC058114]|uniref:diglucosylglycerate octanoyltransferase n=1 Tax=Nocardia sp. NPDC058114 TaxID=3346346 RepID=UPI0036DAA682
MSNEEPDRSVPDEMFQQVTAKAGRQLPDALFGPPPARPARAEREEPIRSVPDELFKQVTARSARSLPDALFGPVPPPVVAEPEPVDSAADVVESGSGTADSGSPTADVSPDGSVDGDSAVTSIGDDAEAARGAVDVASSSAVQEADSETSGATASVDVVADDGSTDELGDVDSGAAQTDTVESAADIATAVADAVSAAGSEKPTEQSVDDPAVAESIVDAAGSTDTAAPQPLRPEASDPVRVDAATSSEVSSAEVATAVETGSADAQVDPPAALPDVDLDIADSLLTSSATSVADPAVEVSAKPAVSPGESGVAETAGSLLVEEAVSPRPVESAAPRPVLLVIADSLAYYGPKGGLPADDPRIWPNMVAAELDWDVELIARIGWTCRDAYWALIGDPRVWAAVPRAGAVVFAVGGMDTLPSPLPTALREMIRYIRPPRLRRGVRASYNWLQPKLSKLGRPVALPPKVSVDYLEQSRTALNHLRPELPVVAVLPSVHKCDAYGRVHRGRARAVKALQAWSGRTSVPLVDLGEAVRDDIESGSANPDGIHWGWAGHAAVATAMTKALQEVR